MLCIKHVLLQYNQLWSRQPGEHCQPHPLLADHQHRALQHCLCFGIQYNHCQPHQLLAAHGQRTL